MLLKILLPSDSNKKNQLFFFKKIIQGTLSVSNGLVPDQDLCSVSPYLGLNCLQRFTSDDKSHGPGPGFELKAP